MNDPLRHYYQRGKQAMLRCEYHAAIDFFEKILSVEPMVDEIRFNLGSCYLLCGDLLAAQACYEALAKRAKVLSHVYYNLGVIAEYFHKRVLAIQCYESELTHNPRHEDARYNLALLELQQNQPEKAQQQLVALLERSPRHVKARYLLAALCGKKENIPAKTPPEFVKDLFNKYAPYFDQHLSKVLEYRLPEYTRQCLQRYSKRKAILDLGCGTGLVGKEIAEYTEVLIGVDLSVPMLEQAKKTGVYTELHSGELLTILPRWHSAFDVVLMLEVLVYFGELQPIIQACRQALQPSGLLILTIESSEIFPWQLKNTARYGHDKAYLLEILARNKFSVDVLEKRLVRKQEEAWVDAYWVVAVAQ